MALTDNLVAYWKLDEASGNRADSHGSNTLTDNNTVASTTGKINSAGDFTSANQEWLSRADNTDLSTGDIDFSTFGWFNLKDKAGYYGLICKWGTSDASGLEYALRYHSDSDRFAFIVADASSNVGSVSADTLGSPSASTWYFIACGHNSTSNDIWISVNAGAADTFSWTTGVRDGAGPFLIGRPFTDTAIQFLNGYADEVAFFKRDIRADLSSFYNSGSGFAYPFSTGHFTRKVNGPRLCGKVFGGLAA